MESPAAACTWRQPLLECFSAESAAASRLTVVNDPDQLFNEVGLGAALAAWGYTLVPYGDPIAFRFFFEHRLRERWEKGEAVHLVVVCSNAEGSRVVPYDLLAEARSTGREFSFSLANLFPTLDPNVLTALEPSQLDRLSEALQSVKPGQLGTNASKDFVLNQVFDLVAEQLRQPPDLLRMLLRRHLRRQQLPELLDRRLLELLCRRTIWRDWPLERLLPNRLAFFSFLQERWPFFLQSQGYSFIPGREPPQPQISGPLLLPFDHDDVRVVINNLFAEGLLEPTTAISAADVGSSWMRIGVVGEQQEDAALRLARLLTLLEAELPGLDCTHGDWEGVAVRWAEVQVLRTLLPSSDVAALAEQLQVLHALVEDRFGHWMLTHYSALSSLPPLPRPVTLDKVAPFLAHQHSSGQAKVALVVVDGLALDQWLLLRDSLSGLELQEGTAWAWVPTITSVSRQAIFAAESPLFFAPSINTTSKEPKHWERFWADRGLRGPAVGYVCQGKGEPDPDLLGRVLELADHPACQALGIVVGIIDQMMHGVVTGLGGMHAQVRQWSQDRAFRQLVEALLERGFCVYVTADHGNLLARGIGRPNVGSVPEEKGERAHVFRDQATRAQVHEAFPGSILWPPTGLPDHYWPLVPAGTGAFIAPGKETVGHGGIALEEVIVPFVRIQEGA